MTSTSSTTAREAKIEEYEVEEVAESFADRCERYRGELLHNGNWLASIERCSGKGRDVLERELPRAMVLFENHIISICETDTLRSVNDYGRRFVSWWRRLNFGTSEEIVNRGNGSADASKTRQRGVSRIEEINRIGDEALKLSRQMLLQNGW